MKVALFAQCMYAPWIEGIKNNSLFLSKELSKEIDLFLISHVPPSSQEDPNLEGLKVHYLLQLHENKFLQIIADLIGAIRSVIFLYRNNITIVAIQYLERSFILPLLCIIFFKPKTKLVLTIYSTDELSIWYKKLFLKTFRSRFQKIIIISKYLDSFIQEIGFHKDKIVYIPLSFDKKRYLKYTPPEIRKKNTILFSAGIHKDAGSFFMVDLAEIMPEHQFIFALRKFNNKSEDELSKLEAYIQKKGVKNIEIRRNIDRMEDLLTEVSGLVLPLLDMRIKMLIPVALLEAMGRGTICFVSDLPNLKILVEHEVNSVIFQKGNIFDLREKISIFLPREDIAKSAFTFAENFSDYSEIAKAYKEIFTTI